ncbi:uncharacterized protein LOC123552472 [Mercenaria mercenaria]|uniref:uncharacterized protein LOC123552472 n=1 Tax=Mercenaria mercenaria TaxID=6596 RepID=UPI00234E8998|nr:uncharacterized protein LOC123552472 [Mercenaria mercenaria]
MTDGKSYPGFTGERFPEKFDIRAMPEQPNDLKPGQLPEDEIRKFFTKGYVVVNDFFKPSELEPVKDAINQYVDVLANKLYEAGKIKDPYSDHGYLDRLCKLEEEFPGANILCFKQMGSVPQALKDLWSNERLLNVVEQLIGPDIAGNPVWNLRTKTPKNEATTVPWHQDCSYTDNSSYNVLIPTAWIPFLDTDENNGCLQIIENGHQPGLVARHQCCWGGTWYTMLEEEEMVNTLGIDVKKQLKTLPIKYGSMVLFNNVIPHRSLDNLSDHVRWSVDLRWQRPSDPACFYGLKDAVVMRSSKDPNLKIDWESFDSINRHEAQDKMLKDDSTVQSIPQEDPDFDIRILGPWMKKWELVHTNRHTEEFVRSEKAQ